ncbi:hypothetical protein PoB_004298300, partial [Plakobranchus ocellatus]
MYWMTLVVNVAAAQNGSGEPDISSAGLLSTCSRVSIEEHSEDKAIATAILRSKPRPGRNLCLVPAGREKT